jgi:hypothetical protein
VHLATENGVETRSWDTQVLKNDSQIAYLARTIYCYRMSISISAKMDVSLIPRLFRHIASTEIHDQIATELGAELLLRDVDSVINIHIFVGSLYEPHPCRTVSVTSYKYSPQ